MFRNLWVIFFSLILECYAASASESVKREYVMQMQNAFALQSEGLSTSAMFNFEQACEKAAKYGESSRKIEAIRRHFVWYRTYGYYLGLMSKNPNIVGQYTGGGKYAPASQIPPSSFPKSDHFDNPELSAARRQYLFGVAEILSGVFCFWICPLEQKIKLGLPLVVDGGKRVFEAANKAIYLREISAVELEKSIEHLKSVAECESCNNKK